MKRNTFGIALFAFAAATAAIGTTVAAIAPELVLTQVYVRRDAGSPAVIIDAGQKDLSSGSQSVIVSVIDNRTPATNDTRIGYQANGTTPLTNGTTSPYPSSVVIN
jgi:hypothetical protein